MIFITGSILSGIAEMQFLGGNFGDGVTRFEVAYGNKHHDHLICEVCNANIEVLDEEIEALQRMLAARYGYTLTSHSLYLYGICPNCKAKSE